MTDRIHSLTVVLAQDVRVDDVQPLVDAICQLRGVGSVTGNVADIGAHVARERARLELREKLWEVLK